MNGILGHPALRASVRIHDVEVRDEELSRVLENAMVCPSGDHAGASPPRLPVRFRCPVPSTLTTKISVWQTPHCPMAGPRRSEGELEPVRRPHGTEGTHTEWPGPKPDSWRTSLRMLLPSAFMT